MDKSIYKDALGWGVGLWLIGYLLGFVFFAFVPANIIGWAIMPIGVGITLWVLFRKIKSISLTYYFLIGITWLCIAVLFDYLFLVLLLNPTDGYYKLDVYMYYGMTLLLPIVVGWYKNYSQKEN